jgi:hypothetical protein
MLYETTRGEAIRHAGRQPAAPDAGNASEPDSRAVSRHMARLRRFENTLAPS